MNEMLKTINTYGIDYTSELLADFINQKILHEEIAIQFVLEELEAASQGNETSKMFAKTSGFDEDDYEGAMLNSFEEVDGIDGPQQELIKMCMMLIDEKELMVELRIKTVDNIMKIWSIGKYSAINKKIRLIDIVHKEHNLEEGIFGNINNDLNSAINEDTDILLKMAYAYARRVVSAALCLQGVYSVDNYLHAKKIFQSLQLSTGQSVEFQELAYSQAIELLKSYDTRFDKEFNSSVITIVETNQFESLFGSGNYIQAEQIFRIFCD